MHLKTPRRYRKQQRRLFGSWRWLRNLILLVVFSYIGYYIYFNQITVREKFEDIKGDIEPLISDVQTAIPRQPTPTPDVSNERSAAIAAYQTGDFVRAIDNYRLVIQGAPNDVESHYRLALLLIITSELGANRTQLEEALDVADRTINANPEAPDGWAIKAMAMVWLERYGEGVSNAQRALEIDPNYVQAKAFLAEAYWRLDEPDLAVNTVDEAIDYLRGVGSAPAETIAAVFRTKGFISERQLDREAAIEAYEIARRAAPTHGYIALELALSYFGNGQIDEAAAMLNQSLDANPRDTAVLFQLGRIYVNQGNGEDALQTFQRCIDIDATYAPCLSWLGGLQYFAGNYPQAISNLEKSIENGSEDLEDWWQLGRAHYNMLRCDLAIPVFREGYALAGEQDDLDMQDRFRGGLSDCGVTAVEVQVTPQAPPANVTPSEFFTATPDPNASPTP